MVQDSVYLFPEAYDRVVALENRNQSVFTFLPLLDPNLQDKVMLEINSGPEQIVALKPDLVILKNFMAEKLGNPLEELGIPVLYLNLENPDVFYKDINVLGQVFGNSDRAGEIIKFYQSRMSRVEELVSRLDTEHKPEVLILEYSDQGGKIAFHVPPVSWLQTGMVEAVGGVPIWTEVGEGGGWTIVTIDQIATWNPDKVFIIDYGGNAGDVVDMLINDPLWKELQSVQNEQIFAFAFDFYSWDQPDTRWILGIQWLITKVQPHLDSEIKILSEVESFYSQLYGLDNESIEKEVIPLLTGDIP
jgi:iron complex transport system substrate-binding protein